MTLKPTTSELADLSLAADKLWQLDTNRLEYGRDFELQLQGCRRFTDGDVAPKPLFKSFDESILEKPTFKSFVSLLDNYTASTGDAEVVTQEEIVENNSFLNAVTSTDVMKYVGEYLAAKRVIANPSALKQYLFDLWFRLYKRDHSSRGSDSSAFEHVFVGEISEDFKTREQIVKGLHNWIQIYKQESAGALNYRGYKRPRNRALNSLKHDLEEEQVLSMQFEWNGFLKPIGTSLIGVSPEFEMALYTLCFSCAQYEEGETSCVVPVKLGPYTVDVQCHKFAGRFVGSVYVEESQFTPDQAATRIQAAQRARAGASARADAGGGGGGKAWGR